MKFFAQCPDLKKKEIELEEKNSSKCSIGHVEGDFDKPHPKKLQQKGKNFLARFAKLRWKRFVVRNSIFLENVPNGHSDCSFGRPAENFATITEKFSLKLCLFRKKSFFWEKKLFSSECFSGHVVTKLYNPAEAFPEEVGQLSNNVPKW